MNPSTRASHMRLSVLHAKFLGDLRAFGRAAATSKAYAADFRHFLAFLGHDDPRAIDKTVADRYPGYLHHQRLSMASIGRNFRSARVFCRWLVRRGEIARNPFDGASSPKEPQRDPRPVPTDVLERVLALPLGAKIRALVCCARYAGLRVSEIINLDLEDVNYTIGTITVRHGKGGRDRAIPLDPALRAALETWIKERGDLIGPLFPGRGAPRMCDKTMSKMWSRVCKQAGVTRFTTHPVRHSFGTEAAAAGVPASVIQKLMGHASLDTTQLYIKVAARDLTDGVERVRAWRQARAVVEEAAASEVATRVSGQEPTTT